MIGRVFYGAVLLLFSNHATAFCLAPRLLVSDEYYASNLVVSGTVVSQRQIIDLEDPYSSTGTFYRLHVDHRYRGEMPAFLEIYSENTTARFPMDDRRRYLLFLSADPAGKWVVDNCGNSGRWETSIAQIRQLASLPFKQSFIYGEVYTESHCPSMTLSVKGKQGERKTPVQPDCSFHLDVLPGKYSAEITGPGSPVLDDDLAYKNPYCFTVPQGGSAGLAFRQPDESFNAATLAADKRDDAQLRSFCKGSNFSDTSPLSILYKHQPGSE